MSETIIKRCVKCSRVGRFSPEFTKCRKCGENTLITTSMTDEEFCVLCDVAPNNNELCGLMIDLKEKEPIEYQLKMSQFKSQLEQQKSNKIQNNNRPKCPTCGSTNIEKISLTKKAVGGAMFGLFSSDIRNSMHCKNCGYKW